MAKRRLNKKVAVFLGIAGALLAVAIGVGAVLLLPKDPGKLAEAGKEYLDKGNYRQAYGKYREAVGASKGRDPKYLVAFGKTMMEWLKNDPALPPAKRSDLFRDARSAFSQALRSDPNHVEAHKQLVETEQIIASQSGDWVPFISAIDKLIPLAPDDHELLFQRAQAKAQVSYTNAQYVPLALEDFHRLLEVADREEYWLALAGFLRWQKQDKEADKTFQDALKAHPQSVNLRVAYAEFLSTQDGRKGEALPLLKQAVELQPKQAQGYLALAQYHQVENQPDQAKDMLQQAAAADPGDYRSYFMLARMVVRQSPDEALAVLNKGMESIRKLAGAELKGAELQQYRMGILVLDHEVCDLLLDRLTDEQDKDKTLAQVNQALQEMQAVSRDSPAVAKIQGRVALVEGNFVEAERLLRQAYDTFAVPDPKTAQLLMNIYYRMGQLGEAEKILQRYLAIQESRGPKRDQAGDAPVLLGLLRLYIDYRDYAAAEKILGRLQTAQPDNPALPALAAGLDVISGKSNRIPRDLKATDEQVLGMFLDRAGQLWRQGDQAAAIQLAQDVLQHQPKHVRTYLQLLQWHKARNDSASATALLQQARQALAEYPDLLRQMELMLETDPAKILTGQLELAEKEQDPVRRALRTAEAYRQARQQDKYYEFLKKAEAETKGQLNTDVQEALFNYALATSNWPEAEKYAKAGSDANLDQVEGRLYRARLAQAQQKWDEAIRLAGEAVNLRPRFSAAHSFLGACYLAAKRYDEARPEFEIARSQNPANVEALLGMVSLSEMAGKQDEYAYWVMLAFRFIPNNPEINERYLQLRQAGENPAEVIRLREQKRQQEPGNLTNLIHLAALYTRVGRNTEAERIYSQLLRDAPGAIGPVSLMADFLRRTNRDAEARTLLDGYAASAQDKVAAYLLWGDYLDAVDDPEQAAAVLSKAAAADPKDPRGHLALANLYGRRGLWKEAVASQQKYLDLAGAKAGPHSETLLVEYLLEADLFKQAQERLDKMLKDNPSDVEALSLRGKAFLVAAAGDNDAAVRTSLFDQARQSLDQALREDANYAPALAYRAELHLGRGDVTAAIADLEKARQNRPGPFVLMRLAQVYARLNDFGNAYGVLQGLVEDRPDYTPGRQALLDLCFGYERWTYLEKALEEGKKAYPNSAPLRMYEAKMWLKRNDPTRALSALEVASKLDPRNVETILMQLQALIQGGQNDTVISAGQQLLSRQDIAPVIRGIMGLAKARKGDPNAADADFAEAVKSARDPAQLQEIIQHVRSAYPLDQAVRKLAGWQPLRPDDWTLPKTLAEMAQEAGDVSAAAGFLQKALPLAKDDKARALTLSHLGVVLQLGNHPEDSVKAYQESLKIEPNNSRALNNLAWLLANDLKRPDEALPHARKAAELAPNSPDVLDTYGLVLTMNGNLPEAERILNRSIDLRASPANRFHMGQLYERMNRPDDARRQYDLGWELVKGDPSNPDYGNLRDARQRLGGTGRTER